MKTESVLRGIRTGRKLKAKPEDMLSNRTRIVIANPVIKLITKSIGKNQDTLVQQGILILSLAPHAA
jgi:hypothetical protein